MSIIFRAWGVVSPKGNAVFLDHSRALEYAGKVHGIVIDLSTTYEQKAPYNSNDIRQEGQTSVERCELIQENPPIAEVFCRKSGDAQQGVLTCGNCGAIETTSSASACQNSNCPL